MNNPPNASAGSATAQGRLVSFLRSPYILLLMLIMALVAQLPHAEFVFYKLIPHIGVDSERQARFYAVVMECLIAVFVIHNWNQFSYLFALVSILTNIAYYQLGGVAMFHGETLNLWVYYLFSIILPVAIAMLTHLFAKALAQPTIRDSSAQSLQENLYKWFATVRYFRVGFIVDLMRSSFTQAPVAEPTRKLVICPQEVIVENILDKKYDPIIQVLTGSPDGFLAGHIAKLTGVAQSTLIRKQGGKLTGWLSDLIAQDVLTYDIRGEKTYYQLKNNS